MGRRQKNELALVRVIKKNDYVVVPFYIYFIR